MNPVVNKNRNKQELPAMPARTLHLSSILQAFSTFLALRRVSDHDAEAAVVSLMSVLKRKNDLSNWDLEEITQSLSSSQPKHSRLAAADTLVLQFVEHFPPFQASTILHKYLFALQESGCSPATIRNYRSDIGQFFAFHGQHELANIMTKPKVLEFLAGEQAKQLKLASIKRKLISLNQFALWLEKYDSDIHLTKNLESLQAHLATNLAKHKPATQAKKTPSAVKHWSMPLKQHPTQRINPLEQTPFSLSRPARAHQDYRARLEAGWRSIGETVRKKTLDRFLPYLNLAMLLLFLVGGAYFAYAQFFRDAPAPLAFPTTPVRPSRTLSFQGRLTDTAQNPIVSATDFRFKLYDATTAGNLLWDSGTCSVDPDQDGIFATGLGDPVTGCGAEITSSVFSENSNIWLEVKVATETLTPRQQIRTVAYALNAETIQGIPVSATEAATANTVVVLNEGGEVVLGEVSPKIRSMSGTFTIDAQSLLLKTSSGSNGDINLSPDGTGKTFVNSRLITTGYLTAPGATLSATYAGGTALVARGGPSGTANIQEWQNAAGAALSVVSAGGNLGIGTSNPTAGVLHVVGQCVTGDTKLRRKRKKKRTGLKLTKHDPPCTKCGRAASCVVCEYYESVRIDAIQPGDSIQTLDEKTGKFVDSSVRVVLDMGTQQVFELMTSHGKKIRTTAKHPYLVKKPSRQPQESYIATTTLEVDQSIRIEQTTKDSYLALANEEVSFAVKLPLAAKQILLEMHAHKRSSKFGFQVFAQLILFTLSASRFKTSKLRIDNEYPGYENEIKAIIRQQLPDLLIEFASIGKKSPAHYSAYGAYKSKRANYIADAGDLFVTAQGAQKKTEDYGESKGAVTPKDKSFAIRSPLGQQSEVYQPVDMLSTKWQKVAQLRPGMMIATIDGFEHIVSIQTLAQEQTYDIEVENTHNFVGNGIVAHNTYISGNVGIGTTGPSQLLDVKGNIAITESGLIGSGLGYGTPAAGSYGTLQLYSGSTGYTTLNNQGFGISLQTAGADRVTILNSGNVGIGTTGPSQKLVVRGNVNFEHASTDHELQFIPGTTGGYHQIYSTYEATGAYLPIMLKAGASAGDQLYLATAGNVGIGTTGPRTNLEISGRISSSATGVTPSGGVHAMLLYNTSGDYGQLFTWDYTGGIGKNLVLNPTSGNVGIGTTAPNAPLHIYAARSGATLNSTPMLRLEDSTAEGINVGPELLFLGTAGGVGTGYASIHAAKENSTAGNYATYLRFGTRANGGSMTEQVRITSDGNVGIGTTGPSALLAVNGAVALDGTAASVANGGMFRHTNGFTYFVGKSDGNGAVLGNGDGTATVKALSPGGTSGYIAMETGAGAEAVRINNLGNVGIGTTGPSQKLVVRGNVNFEHASTDHELQFIPGTTGGYHQIYSTYEATGAYLPIMLKAGASAGDQLYLATAGNVGIGTTNPLQQLHVVGNCVVGNTLLSIRRRKKKQGESDDEDELWEYLLCRIDEIVPGDEVLSLNEASGDLEYARINKLMDMGVKEVYELTTKSGRKITTTAEHPFLTRQAYQ